MFSPVGDLCGLLRRPSCFCAEGGRHRSPELPRRSNDSAASILVGAGRALAATGPALHPRSFLGRPIWMARISGNALAVTSAPELGNHQGPSTNSSSSPAVMLLWHGFILAAAAGEA